MIDTLVATEPKRFRTSKLATASPKVERKGGYAEAGLIRGVSLNAVGEALGHDVWLDSEFVESVTEHAAMPNKGLKARFTHPTMSSDGMGRFLGRFRDPRTEGDKSVADLHLSKAAHNTPDGNLAEYVMALAEEDPEAFGLSIVFYHDEDEANEFVEANSVKGAFTSPDPNNKENLPHARLKSLQAADVVDEPAANPDGLFHRGDETHEQAERLISYALGLSDDKPVAFGIDGDKAKGFVARYLTTNNLEIKGIEMAEVQATNESPEAELAKPEEKTNDVILVGMSTEEYDERGDAKTFLETFGTQGAVWFAEGLSFEECLAKDRQDMRAELEELRQKLSVPQADGEDEALNFSNGETDKPNKGLGLASKLTFRE